MVIKCQILDIYIYIYIYSLLVTLSVNELELICLLSGKWLQVLQSNTTNSTELV